MKKNFNYAETSRRASLLYQSIIAVDPSLRGRGQWYICLREAAAMTDAEAAKIAGETLPASRIWDFLPESEKIQTVKRFSATVYNRAARNGRYYADWMLSENGKVAPAAVELVFTDAFCYLPDMLAKADQTGKSYIVAVLRAVDRACYAENSFRHPGKHSRSGGTGASLDEINESGEKAKLGSDALRNVSRPAEDRVLSRIAIENSLNSRDSAILKLSALGYSSKEISEKLDLSDCNVRQRLHRIREKLDY